MNCNNSLIEHIPTKIQDFKLFDFSQLVIRIRTKTSAIHTYDLWFLIKVLTADMETFAGLN